MDSLFLINTVDVTGEYEHNGSTIKIVGKSNPCTIRVEAEELPCMPCLPCVCDAKDESLLARQDPKQQEVIGLVKKETFSSIHICLHVPQLHCICAIKSGGYSLDWCCWRGKAYLKIQWHYVLLYYNRRGQRKCYCGFFDKYIPKCTIRNNACDGLRIADYHCDMAEKGKLKIGAKIIFGVTS